MGRRLLVLLVLCGACASESTVPFDNKAAVQYLRDNEDQLRTFADEFVSRVPDSLYVRLELVGSESVDFQVVPRDLAGSYVAQPGEVGSVSVWDVPLSDPDVQRGLRMLGWSERDLGRISQGVRAVGGIGVSGSLDEGGALIAFRRHGLGLYSFALTDSAMVTPGAIGYDGCARYYLNTRAALEFGGAAFGKQCMDAAPRFGGHHTPPWPAQCIPMP